MYYLVKLSFLFLDFKPSQYNMYYLYFRISYLNLNALRLAPDNVDTPCINK